MDIVEKRKNMAQYGDEDSGKPCKVVNQGVDLNRNFGYDFKLQFAQDSEDEPGRYNPCSEFYAGPEAFSEKETQALRDFITANKDELRFVVNFHSNGNAFLTPFSSVYPNDIQTRAPKAYAVLQDIEAKATFPDQIRKGNFADVFGKRIGGDADDYVTGTFGIPSVTNELGNIDMYIDNYWIVKSKEQAFEIVTENSKWLQYVFLHLPEYSKQL
jgi:hypothetical protein